MSESQDLARCHVQTRPVNGRCPGPGSSPRGWLRCTSAALVAGLLVLAACGSEEDAGAPTEIVLLAGATEAGGRGYADGHGAQARMASPIAVVLDRQARPVVLDTFNLRLRRLDDNGHLGTLARFPDNFQPSADGRFVLSYDLWRSLALGPDGSIFVAARQARFVRTADGAFDNRGESWVVLRLAENGSWSVFLDPLDLDNGGVPFGSAISAMAFDAQGRLLLADQWQCAVRRLEASGRLSLVFTTAPAGASVCRGFDNMRHGIVWMALDASGQIAVGKADGSALLHRVDGVLQELPAVGRGAVTGSAAAFDRQGRLWQAGGSSHVVQLRSAGGELGTLAGQAGESGSDDGRGNGARFNNPTGLALREDGVAFVTDNGNHTLRRVTADGQVTTVAGLAPQAGYRDGPGAQARFRVITDIAADAAGQVFVADPVNRVLRRVDRTGAVSTHAGRPGGPAGPLDGPREVARFDWPQALTVTADGALYVVEYSGGLRQVAADGAIRSLPVTAGGGLATGLVGLPDGGLLVSIGNTGFSLLGDSKTFFYLLRHGLDGSRQELLASTAALRSQLGLPDSVASMPLGLAVAGDGAVWFTLGHAVLRRTTGGEVQVMAGALREAGSADGPAAQARFDDPRGLAIDAQGQVYVADRGNHTVRRIGPRGQVSTVLGRAGQPGVVLGAAPGGLDRPQQVLVTADGLVVGQALGLLLARW